MNPLFKVHMLNDDGKKKAVELAEGFDALLTKVEEVVGLPPNGTTRELALVKTHMELASFYAKKAMATKPENQQ